MSTADEFYSFDNNTWDLKLQRNGEIAGGPVQYVQGYVARGNALALNQSIPTQINLKPSFDLNINSNLTVEGFFYATQSSDECSARSTEPDHCYDYLQWHLERLIGREFDRQWYTSSFDRSMTSLELCLRCCSAENYLVY